MSDLGEEAANMVERDIETETEWAIDRVLADVIRAEMVEKFRDRYDLGDPLGYVQRRLKTRPRSSWRSALRSNIQSQGRTLRDEIEDAVREYLPNEDGE
jgi:hypothetical protein